MKEEILKRLGDIEQEHLVSILYAWESGSRAWGFPSADSDYDIRFLYLHPREWYLSVDLEKKPDVIQRPLEGKLDSHGWDLRKALQLLRKGNPQLTEWSGSPIVYREQSSVAAQMRTLAARHYSPAASLYHYHRMAQGNYREHLQGPVVRTKKYFYVLRPLLAVKWIEQGLGIVPTEFAVLVDRLVDSPELAIEIRKLVASKRQGDELDRGPRIDVISDFVANEMARLAGSKFKQPGGRVAGPVHEFNQLFRAALAEVWP